jgi:hypothetical protein
MVQGLNYENMIEPEAALPFSIAVLHGAKGINSMVNSSNQDFYISEWCSFIAQDIVSRHVVDRHVK